MKSLLPLWNELRRRYYARALKEMHPLHADVPHVLLRLRELERSK